MEKKIISELREDKFYLLLIVVVLFYFIARLGFYALKIPHYIPPDEVTHFGYCVAFSKTWGFPSNTPETYQLGNLMHIPWLYYYLMGKALLFKVLPISDLLYLRGINILLACFTFFYSYRWLSLFTKKWNRVFFLVVLTNIPMFTFLGASVSYDNLVNLCAVMALYYMHRFFLERKPAYFLLAGIALLAGSLTKIAFLPLVLIYTGIILVHERDRLKLFPSFISNISNNLRLSDKGLVIILTLLLVMCFELYGMNILKFHKLVPATSQVMSEEQFMQHRISARDYVITKFRSGEWDYQTAVDKAKQISHPGDQATALHILRVHAANQKNEISVLSRLAYSYNWFEHLLGNGVGITAHRSLPKTINEIAIYQTIFLLAVFVVVRFWRRRDAGLIINQSLIIVLCYGFFLMLFHNYNIYLWSLSPYLGIQGRYIFPILIPLLGVFTFYLTNNMSRSFRISIALLISIFFIWGDFPYFYANADSTWFNVPKIEAFRFLN